MYSGRNEFQIKDALHCPSTLFVITPKLIVLSIIDDHMSLINR